MNTSESEQTTTKEENALIPLNRYGQLTDKVRLNPFGLATRVTVASLGLKLLAWPVTSMLFGVPPPGLYLGYGDQDSSYNSEFMKNRYQYANIVADIVVIVRNYKNILGVALLTYGSYYLVQEFHQHWTQTNYSLLVEPKVAGEKMLINGVVVDSMIVDQNNNLMCDYKERPLINLWLTEDGTLLFNRRPIIIFTQNKYTNLGGDELFPTPDGNFRDTWNVSHGTFTPISTPDSK